MNMGGWAGYGEEIAETLRARDYKDPSVVFIPTTVTYAMTTEMTPKLGKEVAPSLRARDYKDPPAVFVDEAMWWNGDDIAGTLTANNANGAQRMPDKENFGCLLVSY